MSIFALALAKLIKQLGFSVYTLYNVQRIHCIQCTHCTNCTMYTMYSPTAGNQSSHIVYTQYSWTALPRGSSPPSGLGLSHRRARRRTIYGKPCNAVGGVLRPSVAPIHLVSQAFPGLEAVGEQPLPGVDSVASAAAEAKLPLSSWALVALWIGGPIRGHHVLSKPSQNSGPVMALTPAVCRLDPNSRAPELKCSIKVEPSKILEDSSVQIFSG